MRGKATKTIHLFCTVHRPNGMCNQDELLQVLRDVNPDVVFEEIRPSAFDDYHKTGTKWSVESQAVDAFAKEKRIVQVPVDDFEGAVELYAEINPLFDYVDSTSQEHVDLNEERYRRAHYEGYEFLNSVDCLTLTRRIRETLERTVLGSQDRRLIQALAKWNALNVKREDAMIRNIYSFCAKQDFKTGIFLVGAAHRETIIDVGQRLPKDADANVHWLWGKG